jgi:hypothetical protein
MARKSIKIEISYKGFVGVISPVAFTAGSRRLWRTPSPRIIFTTEGTENTEENKRTSYNGYSWEDVAKQRLYETTIETPLAASA